MSRPGLPADWNEEDPTHPVPYPGKVDVLVETQEGEVHYGLVIAAPLRADERSQQRLLQKLEDYISDRRSDASLQKYGQPTPDNTHLLIAIHPDSDRVIFELIEKCRPWLEGHGFSFKVRAERKLVEPQ